MEKNRRPMQRTEDESVIVGRNPVMELLKSGRDVEKLYIQKGEREGSITKIFAEAKKRGIVISEVDKKRLDEISFGNAHQGVAAVASSVEYKTVEEIVLSAREKGEAPLIVVCDGVEDPHNLGAIIRCAECCGAHGLVIPKRRAAGLTPLVTKASAGAIEHLAIAKVSNITNTIEQLKKEGVPL